MARWARENFPGLDFKISFGHEAWDAPQYDVSLIFDARLDEEVMHPDLAVSLQHAARLIREKKFKAQTFPVIFRGF